MAKTLGATINNALRVIGEPDITEFTSANQLQNILIDTANEAVHDILEAARYRWGMHRDYFTTHDDLTTGTVVVTNGSTTVTSSGNNFTNVAAGDLLRVTGDQTSYVVASVNTSANPDTLVLEDAYQGTTASAAEYVIFRDTYALSITGLDEVVVARYGENAMTGSDEIRLTNIQNIYDRADGDIHKNTSGKPKWMAQRSPNSSNNPQWVLWPYPKDAYVVELWHTIRFTSNTTFATEMFGGDAPDIAYDAVSHKCRERACLYDEDMRQAQYWAQQYERARFQLVSRESRAHRDDRSMSVETYRRGTYRVRGFTAVSQIAFDRV